MLGILLSVIAVLVACLYVKTRKSLNYWQSKGVFVPRGLPFIGHMYHLGIFKHRWVVFDEWYNRYKDKKFFGYYEFTQPCLMVTDVDMIRNVLVKDANYFVDRRDFNPGKTGYRGDLVFSEFLTVLKGEKWKKIRTNISPTFTSGKIKLMYPTIISKAQSLVDYMNQINQRDGFVRMDDVIIKYTIAVIASCAFGFELPIQEEKSTFEQHAKTVFDPDPLIFLKAITVVVLPEKIVKAIGLRFSNPNLEFYIDILIKAIEDRKNADIRRNDFVDLIQDAFKEFESSSMSKEYMTEYTMIAQCLLFLFAGFDTTSTALTFTFYLLAKHPEMQEKLREELREQQDADGTLSYESLTQCKYLNAIFSESLRMYGPGFFVDRQCTQSYKVPDHDLVIEPGNVVVIPIWSLHYDSDFWDEPQKFKPERFMDDNKDTNMNNLYMPFGAGPRMCIAMRFALLKSKVAIANLVLNHRISLPVGKEKLILNSGAFALRASKHGVFCHFDKIESA